MKENLLQLLENSRTYTLRIADAMPENKYESKPAEGVWNFRELLSHLAYGITWWESNSIKGVKMDWNPPEPAKTAKAAKQAVDRAYDSLKETVTKAKADDQLFSGFHATLDHITHHRGQATIYLRSQGITPPDYMY